MSLKFLHQTYILRKLPKLYIYSVSNLKPHLSLTHDNVASAEEEGETVPWEDVTEANSGECGEDEVERGGGSPLE